MTEKTDPPIDSAKHVDEKRAAADGAKAALPGDREPAHHMFMVA